MMQLDELVLYNSAGATRSITFRAGELNVITGDSRTGKSSLINIVRFLLGGASPNVPVGPIRQTVTWYALHAHVGSTRFFVARAAPPADRDSNDAMLLVGDVAKPNLDQLEHNTSRRALRDYLGGLEGLEDNLNVPGVGQTRRALSASFVHSLVYCFQGQGEIANPEILFHRQNREFMPQTIRDTLPYFLGAQGADDLRRRQELTERRRDLRRLNQRLRLAESERAAGVDRAGALLAECVDVGLLTERVEPASLEAARFQLRRVLDNPAAPGEAVELGSEFDRYRARRAELSDQVRDLAERLRALDQFAAADQGQATELSEHQARLASVGLVPTDTVDATCALCDQPIGSPGSDARGSLERSLARAERRLDIARRDTPRIGQARDVLLERQRTARDEVRNVDQALAALADRDELVQRSREAINVQSYVRGRIALYLDNSQEAGDDELDQLRSQIDALQEAITRLSEVLDNGAVRSRTTSLLRTVSRQMTTWAQQLGLEHASDGVMIDLDRLTIVADTSAGPAYMDAGGIGSGMNWVGYHLTAYLALQNFFLEHQRPVPAFIVLDQPSQAFFPRDRESGGDLSELTDTDRENTRQLYELIVGVVRELGGDLQVIALDHADFEDDWFAGAVIERWRNRAALIPPDWLQTAASAVEPSDATG